MHIVYLILVNSTLGGWTKFPSVRWIKSHTRYPGLRWQERIGMAQLLHTKSNGNRLQLLHWKTQTIHCRHHIQKLGKHISFRKWFQPECKYNKSVRTFTAVRGRPFIEELTLKISNKLLSSVIRERDSWLLKLSLDFLKINE